ncbi:sensor histidine kinase [Subtercola endophyticus]|uniref:sensor histidine kinase n=1 Tax=Subtercola endophyticus TaxID=2895559 RepID=UPI001E62AA37|nr:histidine kinase [Subtercola endophyticus]UFS58979.1 histidine kinase [Subtercola endophyticus]
MTDVRGAAAADDELRLPRPPGVFRLFFARHPWFVDGALVVLFAAPVALYFVLRLAGVGAGPWPVPVTIVGVVSAAAIAAAILFRRAHPLVLVGVVTVAFFVVFPSFGPVIFLPALYAPYAVAVYRSVRLSWVSFGIMVVALAIASLIASNGAWADALGMSLSLGFLILIATLIGVNVGNRKRYVAALVDRAAQLARERDQQALLATVSERARIAREMHDIVAHSLTVMVALADGAEMTAERDPARAAAAMRQVGETGRTALADMRVVLGVLAEPVDASRVTGAPGTPLAPGAPLAPLPGANELGSLIQSYRNAGMVVHFTVSGLPAVDPSRQVAVFRVVQESLTNSLRYAPNPKHVTVVLEEAESGVTVRVTDVGTSGGDGSRPSGQGPAPAAAAAMVMTGSGRGIIGMRERVAAFGGTLDAGPTASGGWQVLAHIPNEKAADS